MASIEKTHEFTPQHFHCKEVIFQSIGTAIGAITSTYCWISLMSAIEDENDCSLGTSWIRIQANLSLPLFTIIGGIFGCCICKKIREPNRPEKMDFEV